MRQIFIICRRFVLKHLFYCFLGVKNVEQNNIFLQIRNSGEFYNQNIYYKNFSSSKHLFYYFLDAKKVEQRRHKGEKFRFFSPLDPTQQTTKGERPFPLSTPFGLQQFFIQTSPFLKTLPVGDGVYENPQALFYAARGTPTSTSRLQIYNLLFTLFVYFFGSGDRSPTKLNNIIFANPFSKFSLPTFFRKRK